jgi:hypothetical protein
VIGQFTRHPGLADAAGAGDEHAATPIEFVATRVDHVVAPDERPRLHAHERTLLTGSDHAVTVAPHRFE